MHSLLNILSEIAKGKTITVTPTHTELTIQEAAELLNVSDDYLLALLS